MTVDLHEALVHHRNGRLDEAARGYEAILSTTRTFDALFYLSQVRAAQQRLEEAYALMHEAAALRPDSDEAQYQLGALLVALDRPHQAVPVLHGLVGRQPNHARGLVALGTALRGVDRVEDAAECFAAAAAAEPAYAEAYLSLGTALVALERPETAVAPLERALTLEPDNARVHTALAGALRRVGRWDEALAHCRRALEIDPQLGEAHANAASALLELGEIDAARAALARALELEPDNASFLCQMASITRVTAGDPLVTRLEAAARRPTLRKTQRVSLHFALGKAYADSGDRERAFDELLRGNALKRTMVQYDEAATLEALARTATFVNGGFVAARRGWGYPSELPLFVVGMPRSGTTLIEQILASHPLVHAAGELPDFQRIAKTVLAGDPARAIDARAMEAGTPEAFRTIGETYVATIARLAPDALRITDKMPANATYLGLIALALPNARVLRARRDPVDTCLSCFSLLFTEGQEFTYDLGELGRYYRAYEALLDHWAAVLPAQNVLDVRYEDVVADLEGQARRIVAFCGLPWDDACLRFYETKRPVQTASVVQVRQPIYAGSVGKWHAYAHRLAPLLEALGLSK